MQGFFLILFALIFATPLLIGISAFIISGKKNTHSSHTVALLFHSISANRNSHLSHFPPDKFSLFIENIINQKLTTCTLKEAATQYNDANFSKVIITFDDAFESFFKYAFPVLQTNNIKVTVFPIAGFIGKASDWDVLPKQIHMNKTQLRTISEQGHEIGSHTMTHSNLTFLSRKDLVMELKDSKHLLEDLIGKPVTSLSFPFGSWNAGIWRIAREIGYCQATCYRHHAKIIDGLIPVRGIYSFDTINDVMEKAVPGEGYSNSIARCRIMSHFAKGTPLWNFRKNYILTEKKY